MRIYMYGFTIELFKSTDILGDPRISTDADTYLYEVIAINGNFCKSMIVHAMDLKIRCEAELWGQAQHAGEPDRA